MTFDHIIERLARRCFIAGGPGGGSPIGGPRPGTVGLDDGSRGSSGGNNDVAQRGAARIDAILCSIPVVVTTPGQPVSGPPMSIPDGWYVEVGPIPGNTGLAFFSMVSRQAAITGPRELVSNANLVFRQIDVRNLADLWINAANAGEGVQFTVRRH